MHKDSASENRFKVLGIFVLILSGFTIFKLFQVSVFEHQKYLTLAEDQQRFESIDPAQRGRIYVYDSKEKDSLYPLAFDVKKYTILAVPRNIKKKDETSDKISVIVGKTSQEIFDQINNDKIYVPPIVKDLDYVTAMKIKDLKISGLYIVPEYSRYYPEKTLASQVLGFVNAEGKGNYGFEGHYDRELQGTSGKTTGEKDTLGRMISLLEQKDAQDGTSYVLTIDRSTQYYVEKKLKEAIDLHKADSGSVVIMDIKTGGIVAMASSPSFDPNNYKEFAANQGVFMNPIISHLYEPGSVFKPISMSAAIDAGTVTPETEGVFDWFTIVDGYQISTAEKKAFGKESMTQVLINSDNVAMCWVASQLGKDNLYKYINSFGFFDKTKIDLDTEQAGYSPLPLKQWKDINTANTSFGQGISVTPMELAAAYATIANKGVYIYPHIVDKIIMPDGTEKKVEKQEGSRVIKEDTANKMVEMLSQVVEQGHAKKAGVVGFRIGGKTGTAQIAENGVYLSAENALGIFNHTLAGFGPSDDPRFAMIVKLEKPKDAKYAETTAAPLFGDIASYLLNFYYKLTPTS